MRTGRPKGIPHTQAWKDAQSARLKGKIPYAALAASIAATTGVPKTEEMRRRMSETMLARNRTEDLPPNQKRCKGCGLVKPTSAFQLRNKTSISGGYYYGKCRRCRSTESAERKRQLYGPVLRERRMMDLYGIGLSQRSAMLDAQGGKCAICGSTEPGNSGWHIDHDHAVSPSRVAVRVRGILCRSCNLLLGHAKDSERILSSAMEYLRNGKTKRVVSLHRHKRPTAIISPERNLPETQQPKTAIKQL